MPNLTDRQKLLIYAALVYAQCNLDDTNEVLLEDPDDEANGAGKITVGGKTVEPFTADEFMDVVMEFAPGSPPPNVVFMHFTKQEAWATLRGLGVAIESDRTAKEDKTPQSWAAQRLAGILEAK